MPELRDRGDSLAALRRNADFALAAAATLALVVAAYERPPAVCSVHGHATLSTSLALLSGLMFLAAIGICLRSRASIAARITRLAKVAGLVLGLLVAVVGVAAVAFLSTFSLADSDNEAPSADGSVLQDDLRDSASLDAYWLGAQFRDASVRRAGSNSVTYAEGTGADRLEIELLTQYGGANGAENGDLVVHTARGDDVVVWFRGPRRPDATLMAETRAAVQSIPLDVTYSGCSR